jgi:hypothetical protein
MKTITVRLLGPDNSVHAEGEVEADKLAEAHVVERNTHVYAFQRIEGFRTAVFKECGPAIMITEF